MNFNEDFMNHNSVEGKSMFDRIKIVGRDFNMEKHIQEYKENLSNIKNKIDSVFFGDFLKLKKMNKNILNTIKKTSKINLTDKKRIHNRSSFNIGCNDSNLNSPIKSFSPTKKIPENPLKNLSTNILNVKTEQNYKISTFDNYFSDKNEKKQTLLNKNINQPNKLINYTNNPDKIIKLPPIKEKNKLKETISNKISKNNSINLDLELKKKIMKINLNSTNFQEKNLNKKIFNRNNTNKLDIPFSFSNQSNNSNDYPSYINSQGNIMKNINVSNNLKTYINDQNNLLTYNTSNSTKCVTNYTDNTSNLKNFKQENLTKFKSLKNKDLQFKSPNSSIV